MRSELAQKALSLEGLTFVADLDPESQAFFVKMPPLAVSHVQSGSKAESLEFRSGDVIQEVGHTVALIWLIPERRIERLLETE